VSDGLREEVRKDMRPILFGTIWFVIGMFCWLTFGCIGGIREAVTGQEDPYWLALTGLFGVLFFFSMPVAIIIEIVAWIKRRGEKSG